MPFAKLDTDEGTFVIAPAPGAGFKIRVNMLVFSCIAGNSLKLRNGTDVGSTDITGPLHTTTASTTVVVPWTTQGLGECQENMPLCAIQEGGEIGGVVGYSIVPAGT
jgi:hypothetical protein